MSSFWSDKRVVVTGGAGFLGASVAGILWRQGCPYIRVCRDDEYDLLHPQAIQRLYDDTDPNIVIHLPVRFSGAEGSRLSGTFYDSFMAATQVMETGRCHGLQKLVVMGAIGCDHPVEPAAQAAGSSSAELQADESADVALRLLQVQTQTYRRHFGFNTVLLVPVEVYGPGDRFNIQTSHVIPRLIQTFLAARDRCASELVLQYPESLLHEFVYVEDAARAIIAAAERYHGDQPLNLVNGHSLTLKALAELIAAETGFTGTLVWGAADRPGWRPRLDLIEPSRRAGEEVTASLVQGIRQTVSWFESTRETLREVGF